MCGSIFDCAFVLANSSFSLSHSLSPCFFLSLIQPTSKLTFAISPTCHKHFMRLLLPVFFIFSMTIFHFVAKRYLHSLIRAPIFPFFSHSVSHCCCCCSSFIPHIHILLIESTNAISSGNVNNDKIC